MLVQGRDIQHKKSKGVSMNKEDVSKFIEMTDQIRSGMKKKNFFFYTFLDL